MFTVLITVKPVFYTDAVLSGHPILRTVAEVPKFIFLIYFPGFTLNETFIKRAPLLIGRGHLKVPEMVKFLLLPKFHHPTCQTPEMRVPPTIFSIFTKRDLTNLFD